jgi:hypothetical protein
MIGLLIAAAAAFVSASASLLGQTPWPWLGAIVPAWLNAALLTFIILELAHTVREQIEEPRLSRGLVCDLLAIGVLSSVRHLLAAGATLTIDQGQGNLINWENRRGEILELAVSAVIVLFLVIGWRLASGSSVEP